MTRTVAGLEGDPVEPARVIKHGRQSTRGHIGADTLHHLHRSQRLSERRDRAGVAPSGLTTFPLGLSFAP